MGVRSDIEEIQIEEDVNTEEDDSSNQGSERQLRARNSKRKNQICTKNKRHIDKEREEFLSQFDQGASEREKRKKNKKHNYKESGRGGNLYIF